MKQVPIRKTGIISSNKLIAKNYKEMCIRQDFSGIEVQPGQFFTILPKNYPVPLLRRPFAYSNVSSESFSFIYEIRGSATQDLALLQAGEELDWIGPLGTSFPMPPNEAKIILLAGGVGVGPIFYLASFLVHAGLSPLVILGARTADNLPNLNWPSQVELVFCTDDGSRGLQGTSVDGLRGVDLSKAVFYSCGPMPMMATIHRIAHDAKRPSWVSVEEIMACGIGACQGCAVPVIGEKRSVEKSYKLSCIEGPVFASQDLVW